MTAGELFCEYCSERGHSESWHSDDGPTCECGHYEADHHRSWFAASQYFPEGGKIVEECEFYGWNEFGGAMQDENGKWIDHCQRFKLKKED